MNRSISKFSQRLIKALTLFFGVVGVLGLFAVLMRVIQLGYGLTHFNELVDQPMLFNLYFSQGEAVPNIAWNNGEPTPINLFHGKVQLAIDQVPGKIMALFSLLYVGMLLVLLFGIRHTLKILDSVSKGAFFLTENALRLRWIGLLNIGFSLIYMISTYFSSTLVGTQVAFEEVNFQLVNMLSFEHTNGIFMGLFLIIIAEVFRIGAQLKLENDLTI